MRTRKGRDDRAIGVIPSVQSSAAELVRHTDTSGNRRRCAMQRNFQKDDYLDQRGHYNQPQ